MANGNSHIEGTLIEHLLGQPLSPLLRANDPVLWMAELAWLNLLQPARPGEVTVLERQVIAAFAAVLLGDPACISHYRGVLMAQSPELAARIEAEALRAAGTAPFRLSPGTVRMVGTRLAEGLEQVARPARDTPGWSPEARAVLDSIVALVAFQARVVTGLRAVLGHTDADARRAA
ncbi:hypothetical protein [Paenirhodobacter sp.]|uniref:hypothetical protein n=1 Tax=Paenirhodobacter sp. TaxID=1965326 RepID=UPI003B3CC370